jgi:hypothetical protein
MRKVCALLAIMIPTGVCLAKKPTPAKEWKPATVLLYRSGAYQASVITSLNTWNWNYGSSANITTTPVIHSYEAIGLGTCNRALLLFHVVPPISYRWRFVGGLVEGESIAYRWTGKDKVRIKLLQNPKQREFTVPVFKVFDWTQVKPNLLTAGFTKLAGFCGPDTAFGNVRTNLLSTAGQNAPVSGKTSEEQSTFNQPKTLSTLTDKDISTMIASGLSPEIVIAKIQSSPCTFDTSPQALEDLKRSGVPNSVILVMVKKSASK